MRHFSLLFEHKGQLLAVSSPFHNFNFTSSTSLLQLHLFQQWYSAQFSGAPTHRQFHLLNLATLTTFHLFPSICPSWSTPLPTLTSILLSLDLASKMSRLPKR